MLRVSVKKTQFTVLIVFGSLLLCISYSKISQVTMNMDPAMMPNMGPTMSMNDGCLDTSMGVDHACMMNMKSYFHSGVCECLLFQQWTIRDTADYFLFCAVLFCICAIRDGVAIGAQVLLEKGKNQRILQQISIMASFLDMLLYGLLVTIEYGIMLIIMSYNIGLFFTIIAGLMVSRFIFYPMTIKGGALPTTCH